MEVEVFLDDIDRDIFKNPTVNTMTWRTIYSDLGPWMPQTKQIGSRETLRSTKAIADTTFNWKNDIVLRQEGDGGLLMVIGEPTIYKLDAQAFQAITILWVGKATSFLNDRKFSDPDKSRLLSQLEQHKIIEWA